MSQKSNIILAFKKCLLSEQFLKETYFFFFEEAFSTINILLWNGKGTWMLKVLHGSINVNKEPLFLRV